MCTPLKLHILILAFSLLLFTAGCTTGGNTTTNPTPTPKLDSGPKGPGSPALTATARVTPDATTCPSVGTIAPAATTGWKTYQDATYHFQFAVPLGWNAGKDDEGDPGSDIAAVFPPGVTVPFNAASSQAERFQVTLNISDPPFDPAHDSSWKAESGTIAVGNIQATLYDRVSADCQQVNRAVVAHIAQHTYQFYLSSPFSNAKQDITLFLGTLQTFSAQ